jgi:DNA-binding response OmpR family regulator
MNEKSALVVEDTKANLIFFERLLIQANYEVRGAMSGQEGLDLVNDLDHLELAIVDMEIPDMSGLILTTRLRKRFPQACIIIATMHDQKSLQISAFQKGCNIFVVKPHGFMELYKRITTVGCEAIRNDDPLVIDQYGVRHFSLASN